ncbi:hypothetical protein BDA99DRAFT_522275 [Phascolomyces articulosus]|uniref:F-box domain-containing protein n=1 Tax=Phascolomyces articulosus TaxID=60185 RepID=A0AAD5JRE7_9FUNG|nr:hypothetical protein BDA99DRAFT_522275 [Phascolomyces articulosus]
MPDFTLLFPAETISEIMQQLNQKDCIECMNVCHRWFDLIPEWTGKLTWRHLHISNFPHCQRKKDIWKKPNDALLKCIGSQVHHVAIICQDSWKVLQLLYKYQCDNIRSLDIHYHRNHHQETTSSNAIDMNQQQRQIAFDPSKGGLFTTMTKFANSLTQLYMAHFPHDFSLMTLLDTLPALIHLSVQFNNTCHDTLSLYDSGNESEIPSDDGSQMNENQKMTRNNNTQLIYLCLDNALDFDIRICNILRRCPQLEYFLLIAFFDRVIVPEVPPDGIQTALTLCPSLQYIHWDTEPVTSGLERKWMESSIQKRYDSLVSINDKQNRDNAVSTSSIKKEKEKESKEDPMAVREIAFSGESAEFLELVLTRSQSTLEHLHFSYMDIDTQFWYDLMHHYEFPNLISLELIDVAMDDHRWPEYLCKQEQLERIKIMVFSEGVDCLDKILTGLGGLNKHLLSLSLEDRYDYHHYNSCCSRLDELCKATHVEQLELIGVPMSNQGVMSLSEFPRLRHLFLDSKRLECKDITKEGMMDLIDKLRQRNKIQSLHLAGFEACVEDVLLEHLARVESLMDIRITSNNNITDTGLDVFRRQSVGRKKKIEVNGKCYSSY